MFQVIRCLMLLLLCLPVAQAAGEDTHKDESRSEDVPGAIVSIEVDKQEFLLGEHILLHWQIQNDGTEPFPIDMGADGRNTAGRALRFKVEAVDEKGNAAIDPSPNPMSFGGMGGSSILKSGDAFWETLDVMKYRTLGPGTWTIRVYHDLGWDDQHHLNADQRAGIPEVRTAPVAKIVFKVSMPDAEQARRIYEEMKTLPKDNSATWGTRRHEQADYARLRYPVYFPLIIEGARAKQPDESVALSAMMFPEATAEWLKLLDSADPHVQKMGMLQICRRPDEAWNDELLEKAVTRAWELLDHNPSCELQSATLILLQARAKKEDLPRAIALLDRLHQVPVDKAKEHERESSLGASLGVITRCLSIGATPNSEPGTIAELLALTEKVGIDPSFRPAGFQRHFLDGVRHQDPFVKGNVIKSAVPELPREFWDEMEACLVHGNLQIRYGACQVLSRVKPDGCREMLLEAIAKAPSPFYFFEEAGRKCGLTRLELSLAILERVKDAPDGAAIFRANIVTLLSYQEVEGELKDSPKHIAQTLVPAWKAYLEKNRDEVNAGCQLDPNATNAPKELMPQGMELKLKSGQSWPGWTERLERRDEVTPKVN